MPVLESDHERYYAFVNAQIEKLKCFDVKQDQILWHYTTGDALISILESGTLHATQVSNLNDSTEIRYGSNLLRGAFLDLLREAGTKLGAPDHEVRRVLEDYASASREDPDVPSNAKVPWFITCFSANGDDLSQWRAYGHGENGYAIGFRASGLSQGLSNASLLVHLNYDAAQHNAVAAEVASATFRYYHQGIEEKRAESEEQWAQEFLAAFRMWVDHLSPMVKHPAFGAEDEYRNIVQLREEDVERLQFRQKATLMSRHLPISYAGFPLLPIEEVRIGPSRHQSISAVSVDTLLRKKGYGQSMVSVSKIPFQQT